MCIMVNRGSAKKAITGNGHEADIFPIYRDILNGNVNLVQNPGYSE